MEARNLTHTNLSLNVHRCTKYSIIITNTMTRKTKYWAICVVNIHKYIILSYITSNDTILLYFFVRYIVGWGKYLLGAIINKWGNSVIGIISQNILKIMNYFFFILCGLKASFFWCFFFLINLPFCHKRNKYMAGS